MTSPFRIADNKLTAVPAHGPAPLRAEKEAVPMTNPRRFFVSGNGCYAATRVLEMGRTNFPVRDSRSATKSPRNSSRMLQRAPFNMTGPRTRFFRIPRIANHTCPPKIRYDIAAHLHESRKPQGTPSRCGNAPPEHTRQGSHRSAINQRQNLVKTGNQRPAKTIAIRSLPDHSRPKSPAMATASVLSAPIKSRERGWWGRLHKMAKCR